MPSTSGTRPGSRTTASVRRRLVVVMGPIASGKSTLAGELAALLRGAGEAVAVVGLDTIAEMALPTLADWRWAHDIHGQVVGAWLGTPIPTIIAEGPSTPAAAECVMRHVPTNVDVLRVLLVSRYETALQRVTADPTRGLSRDPDFLEAMYRQFAEGLPAMAYDLRLDSDESPPAALASRVVAALQERHPAGS